jgi:alginate O-acetyltransferase complex protein AlgJ
MTNPPAIPSAATRAGYSERAIRFHPSVERLVIVVFLFVLALPPIGTALGVARATADLENRTLASFPHLDGTWTAWRNFPDAFTAYFADSFAFRPMLVHWQAVTRLKLFDVSPSRAVIKGRDGWWFYADDGAMDDYAKAPPFTADELEQWRRTLQDTTDWLRARGIAYLFVIAPDKHQIYPEYMPATIRRALPSRTDQLIAHLAAHSTVPVLDLRPALLQRKPIERLYHRTDTHWNDRGAYVAYTAIMSSLAPLVSLTSSTGALPALRFAPRDAFDAGDVRQDGLDLARTMGLSEVLAEDDLVLAPRRPRAATIVEPLKPEPHGIEARLVTELPDASKPRAIVFRDSFGSGLIPFLSEHFRRAVYLWQNNLDPKVIAAEHPDVVIQELVGRRFSTLTPYNPFEQQREVVLPASTRQTSPARRATGPR